MPVRDREVNDATLQAPTRRAEDSGRGPCLRIVHHLARSGGTLFSRCISSMNGVWLLSEMHPLAMRMYNPLGQAIAWYGLFGEDDFERFRRMGRIHFVDAIAAVVERVEQRGGTLVLREWSHLDFIGVPFREEVGYDSMLVQVLEPLFPLRRLATVRHPVDQWLSSVRAPRLAPVLSRSRFLYGYRRFAELAAETGFLRYEELCARPEATMRELCRRLDIGYDPGFLERHADCERITGDTEGFGRARGRLRCLERRSCPADLLLAFERSPDYRASLDLLGYDHPEGIRAEAPQSGRT